MEGAKRTCTFLSVEDADYDITETMADNPDEFCALQA